MNRPHRIVGVVRSAGAVAHSSFLAASAPRASVQALLAIACVAAVLTVSGPLRGAEPSALPTGFASAAIIPIHGEINDITLDSVKRRLKQVRTVNVPLVVFEMNTPGGSLDATLKICHELKRLRDSGTRVYAWVHPEAYSAGAIIALAADGIVMSSNATLGDCQPITMTGNGAAAIPADLEAKALSPLLAELRDSARRSGYDMDLVMGLIRPDTQVYWLENTKSGERRFVGPEEMKSLTEVPSSAPSGAGEGGAKWRFVNRIEGLGDVTQPVKDKRELLTLRTPEAHAFGWSLATLDDVGALRAQFGIQGDVYTLDRTWWEAIVSWLASPVVRGLLFILIVLGAYAEFHTPGFGLAGGVAIGALILFLGAPYLAGFTVTWEVVAVLLGIILLVLELFVIPGFGVAGITGLLLIAIGFLASYIPQEPGFGHWPHWPQLKDSQRYLVQGLWSMAAGMCGSLIGMVALSRYLPRLPVAGRLVLKNPTRAQVVPDDPYEGLAGIGYLGVAETLLRPAGKARFGAALIDVVSEGEYLEPGTRVEVVAREGVRVVVRRV